VHSPSGSLVKHIIHNITSFINHEFQNRPSATNTGTAQNTPEDAIHSNYIVPSSGTACNQTVQKKGIVCGLFFLYHFSALATRLK
jgi:hypothetical protein